MTGLAAKWVFSVVIYSLQGVASSSWKLATTVPATLKYLQQFIFIY